MVLRAENAEDDYARLVRRMNRLERIMSEQVSVPYGVHGARQVVRSLLTLPIWQRQKPHSDKNVMPTSSDRGVESVNALKPYEEPQEL